MPENSFSELQEGFSERSLPHSVEAEQSVLGSILLEPEMLSVALEYIRPESFYIEQHKELFRLMVAMFTTGTHAEQMDIVVVLNEAVRQGIFENAA
jgi:replicative DNA helicase